MGWLGKTLGPVGSKILCAGVGLLVGLGLGWWGGTRSVRPEPEDDGTDDDAKALHRRVTNPEHKPRQAPRTSDDTE